MGEMGLIGSKYLAPEDAFISQEVLKDFPALFIMNEILAFTIDIRKEFPEMYLTGDSEQLLEDTRHEYAMAVFREWFS